MIRVLHVFNSVNRGGAETVIMNYYRKIDREKIQFDFVVHENPYGVYENEIRALGGKVYYIPKFKGINIIQYLCKWYKLLNDKPEISIVHGHMPSTACLYLAIGKICNKITIAHSHTNDRNNEESYVKHHMRRFMYTMTRYIADYFYACSNEAGIANFGKEIVSSSKFYIWRNAIDLKKFCYDNETRENIRRKIKCNSCSFVIGHVGRFVKVKNHDFIIEIFNEVHKKNENAKLLLVGSGERKKEIKEKVYRLGLDRAVIFTGDVTNVNEYMMGMDVMILPSFYEGIPTVAIEAQAVGIPCLLSDRISKESRISNGYIKYISLTNKKEWVNEIINIKIKENYKRKNIDDSYDINKASKRIVLLYNQCVCAKNIEENIYI